MKLYFDVIYGNRQLNEFMVACDVFDGGKKQLGSWNVITIDTTDDYTLDEYHIHRTLEALREGFEKEGRNVSFIGFRSGKIDATYVKEGIQTISSGEHFQLFRDCLVKMKYEPTTDQYMQVTGAKYIPQEHS